jgi:hypothetical protein
MLEPPKAPLLISTLPGIAPEVLAVVVPLAVKKYGLEPTFTQVLFVALLLV